MEGDNQPTCGKGLAANAALPAKLAELVAARAEVLERHTQALDLTDPNARHELDAYTALARAPRYRHRAIGSITPACIGIDLAGVERNPTGVAVLRAGRLERLDSVSTDEEIHAVAALAAGGGVVAI